LKTYVAAMHAKKFTLLVLLLITGCSSVPSVLYKIDIQQGNVITQEMVDKLKPGMTRSQVRFVLGTALIDDVFHKDRWDYVYRLVQHGNLVDEYKLTVFFEDDKLARTEGDFSDSLASVSPKLIEPAKYPVGEEQGARLTPEPTVSGVEKGEELPSKPPVSVEQDATPTIIAIEDDTISSQNQIVPDTELDLPPPPPGISDGIEAD
jgi:outer membrane protein assembly factor BamE